MTDRQRSLFGGEGEETPSGAEEPFRFNGPAYEPQHDRLRLTGQIRRIWDLMLDGRWRTLHEIEEETGDPPASISAQLRHLRKPRFGAHTVNRRHRGDRQDGLWEYQLVPSEESDG